MKLSSTQIALMSRLLDEALLPDAEGRRRWLENLTPAHREIAQALREGAAAIGAQTVLGSSVDQAAQDCVR